MRRKWIPVPGSRCFFNQSLRTKLIFPVMITMILSLCINLLLFGRIDTTVKNMDHVYATNIRLGELEGVLTELERDLYEYLNIQSQDALETYSANREIFLSMIREIDPMITDHPARRMERNIRSLALSYMELADSAIEAKKCHDPSSYRNSFSEIQRIYAYLLSYIGGLNDLSFQANSKNYDILYQYLRYLELFMTAVLVGVTCCLMALLYGLIGTFTRPLEKLALKANEVGHGNFEIELEEPESSDEVGTVTVAFNQMICSINEYIRNTRESMELEIQMKERELAMENLLKDAQLKYYQAQIDPHFLFNTLNAGQQLAMMEDAERTYAFIENMASFFRYRLRQNGEESTLGEEIELIDNYMYIMNVRYSGEIHLEKSIDSRLLDILFPGMVLQPVVENALRHGLGDVDWEKRIRFSVQQENGEVLIRIQDNGVGISEEVLKELQKDDPARSVRSSESGNGIGMVNVRERLRLYFQKRDVMTVESEGTDKGTSVIIRTPILRKNRGTNDV